VFGELERNFPSGQFLVNRRECVHLMFNSSLLNLIQMHLDQLGPVQLHTDALADDLSREHQILEDGIVNGCQGARPRAFLLVLGASLTGGLREDLPLPDEDNVLAAELLLELAHQPDLDLLERLQLRLRDVNYDRFLIVELNFTRLRDVKLPQLRLEVGVHFQLKQGLGDLGFKSIGLGATRLYNLRRHLALN